MPYFMDFETKDIKNSECYVVSFKKVVKIFVNVQQIHFINCYKFDDIALQKLIGFLHSNQKSKLKKIKFLYYDYPIKPKPEHTALDKRHFYPTNPKIFFDPDRLDGKLLKTLDGMRWVIRHKNIGVTGYEIQIHLNE